MLIHHQTPYTYNTPYGPYPAVWMPTTLGLFFPIGFVSCDIASKLWLIAEVAGFVWVFWMISGSKMPSVWVFIICMFVFFFFPPLWVHIILGQFSMLFVIIMVILVYLPKAERFTPLILVLGLTKPQLAILIYPGILISVWRKKGWRQAVWLVLSTGLCTVLSIIPLFLYYPGWLADFLFITFDNLGKGWGLPTLFVQLPFLIGTAGYGIWAIIFLAALVVALWLWIQKESRLAMIASLAMTPMVTAYASSWDFMLLLPAFFWLILNLRTRVARAALLAGMLFVVVAQITIRWHQDIADGSQWWVPPVLILVYLASLAIEHSNVLVRKLDLAQNV